MAGMRRVLKFVLLLIALGLGVVAWDVYRIRALRPPDDRSFEGFRRAGREATVFFIDDSRGLLKWIAPPARTLVPASAPPVYVFDRRGSLVDWSPGEEKGVVSGEGIHRGGRRVTVEEAWAWLLR